RRCHYERDGNDDGLHAAGCYTMWGQKKTREDLVDRPRPCLATPVAADLQARGYICRTMRNYWGTTSSPICSANASAFPSGPMSGSPGSSVTWIFVFAGRSRG